MWDRWRRRAAIASAAAAAEDARSAWADAGSAPDGRSDAAADRYWWPAGSTVGRRPAGSDPGWWRRWPRCAWPWSWPGRASGSGPVARQRQGAVLVTRCCSRQATANRGVGRADTGGEGAKTCENTAENVIWPFLPDIERLVRLFRMLPGGNISRGAAMNGVNDDERG